MMRRYLWLALLVGVAGMGVMHSAYAQKTINEARTEAFGTTVTVEGTVTRAYGSYARIQDESGPTGASAIVLRQVSGSNSEAFRNDIADGTIQPGTRLEVTGTTSAFYSLIQINGDDLDDYTVQGQGEPPSPQSVTLAKLQSSGEDYESELLRIDGLGFASASGSFQNRTTYTVEDGSGEQLELRVQDTSETAVGGTSIPQSAFAFEGVLGQFHGEQQESNSPNEGYQLIPIRESDLQPTRSFNFTRRSTIIEESDGTVSVDVQVFNTGGSEVSVTARVSGASTATSGTDVTGFEGPQTLTFSGDDPPPQTLMLEPVADDEQEGVERLEVALSSDDGAISNPGTFTIWILDNPAAQAPVVEGDSGNTLVDSLFQRYGDPPTIGYDAARDSLYRRIHNEEGTVEGIYSGYDVSVDPNGGDASDQALNQGVNTEHVWPRSQGADQEPALSNLHILAPARDAVNSARSNYAFGEIPDPDTDTWYFEDQSQSNAPPESERPLWTELDSSPSDRADRRFEPRHRVKGDVARAVFYFVMAYPTRANLSFFEDQRERLLDWHRADPVDATEMRRSLLRAGYQGNKINPFVVDSTLADRAFGSGAGTGGEVLSLAEARGERAGRTVTVEGTVTRTGPGVAILQDDTAGLYVFEPNGEFARAVQRGTVEQGARLEVTGTLEYYNGLLQLTSIVGFDVEGQDVAVPEPTLLTLGEIASQGETYESQLVRVNGFSIEADGDEIFQAGGTQGNYEIENATGSLTLRIPSGSALEGMPIPKRATFKGALGQFNGQGNGADDPDSGYQLLAFDESDLTSVLPRETTIDVTRSFGDPGTGESYRLVALPGQVDRRLASTLSGENGRAWEAYWDDGSDQDFLVQFDDSDTFDFRPGRGFWLLSTNDWSVEGTVSTVTVENGAATVPLHDGWNIVSNPLPRDVPWGDVVEANGGGLQALWRWEEGQFQQDSLFAATTSGKAFYFLNDQGLDQLSIPVSTSAASASSIAKATEGERAVELTARREGEVEGRVRVAEHAAAEDGRDPQDLVAPPSPFSGLTLHLKAPFENAVSPRQKTLARDVRATGAPGQTYTLVLQADTTDPVALGPTSLPGSDQTEAVLLDPDTGEAHDLRREGAMTVTAGPEPTQIQLLVGESSYVRNEASDRVPETLTVESPVPNPFRHKTTLRYALPDAQEVRVAVYDLLGRQVQILVDRRQDAGVHEVTWRGRDGSRELASGTYLIRLSADGEHHVEKIVLVR